MGEEVDEAFGRIVCWPKGLASFPLDSPAGTQILALQVALNSLVNMPVFRQDKRLLDYSFPLYPIPSVSVFSL